MYTLYVKWAKSWAKKLFQNKQIRHKKVSVREQETLHNELYSKYVSSILIIYTVSGQEYTWVG